MQPITMLPLARPQAADGDTIEAPRERLPLVLVGGSDPHGAVAGAAKLSGRRLESVAVVQELDAWGFGIARQPAAFLIPLGPHAVRHVAALQRTVAFRDVPLIGLTEAIGDLAFHEGFAAGLDDVCTLDRTSLTATLRALDTVTRPDASGAEGRVIVADRDRGARVATASAFRRAGFEVRFASGPDDLEGALAAAPADVVVVSVEIADAGARRAPLAKWAESVAPASAWIVTTPPRDLGAVTRRIGYVDGVRITAQDAGDIPSDLLFVSNTLRNQVTVEQRRAARILYGTSVEVRRAGRRERAVGFTYNVSSGGLYVRTLAPPPRGEAIWLELTPPRCSRLVHLEATVMWARRYGREATAVAPPGFGARITGGSHDDLTTYRNGLRDYVAAATGKTRVS